MGLINMGLGKLGGSQLIFKRQFRWTFEIRNICGGLNIPASFVKVAARPNLSIEETQIDFLNARSWIPAKASWETITVTYYDVATNDNLPLFNWLASVYNFTDPIGLGMASMRSDYSGLGIITLYDGCGNPLERWTLGDCWPQAINFNELDYGSSEICTIDLTLRYSEVAYSSLCPSAPITSCCSACVGGTGGISLPPSPASITGVNF